MSCTSSITTVSGDIEVGESVNGNIIRNRVAATNGNIAKMNCILISRTVLKSRLTKKPA